MPTEKLTDRRVNAATTNKDRIDIFDAIAPGLSLRVTKAGSKSWIVNYRSPMLRDRNGRGKPMRFMLGKYPAVELVAARDQARDVMRRIAKGEDPQVEKRRAKPTGSIHRGAPVTVSDGVRRYIDEHVKVRNKPRQRADGSKFWEREQLLERHVISSLGGMPITEVARKDVMAM